MHKLLLLIGGHYLCDFGLQTDFIFEFRTPGKPSWGHVMTAHCAMHAAIVLMITNSWKMALAEFAIHFAVDCAKCKNKISMNVDQSIHLLCKLVWCGLSGF